MKKQVNNITACICLALVCLSFTPNDNILYWKEGHRLSFSDFKGQPSPSDTAKNSKHKLGGITKSIDVQLNTRKGSTTFTIYAGMATTRSWIRDNTDSVTLRHEQGHFDICEIYARMLRRELHKARSLAEAKILYDNISDEEELEQEKYDKENNYEDGGITQEWKSKIATRLKELDGYKTVTVVLPIDK